MSIRFKLIVLVVITSLAGASSLLLYNLMMNPVTQIEKEQKVLENLSYSFIDYIGQVNQLDSEDFLTMLAQVEEKRKALDDAFRKVETLEFLPLMNDSVRQSLETIQLFSTNLKNAQNNLDTRTKDIIEAAEKQFGKNSSFTVLQLTWQSDTDGTMTADDIKERVFFLISSITSLNKNATQTLARLEDQYKSIAEDITSYTDRARRMIVLVILGVIIIPLLFILALANMLAGRIRKIEIGISRMKEGDLADRITVKSRDELGRLSRNVNDFTDQLSISMLRIIEASKINNAVKESLSNSVRRVSQTTNQVKNSAQSISEEIAQLDNTVRLTDSAVLSVEEQLKGLENALNEQVSMVEETTAAITQMIASIGNVSAITTRKKDALTKLVGFSDQGGQKIKETNQVISRIHNSIEEIKSTTELIADISARTNLLAMNAAIEAAHAGEAGRGFAVVADEIRKLAEATSANSKRIEEVMKEIIGNIEDAAESGKNTGEVFQFIDKEVKETTTSFAEIAGNMDELKTGGTQILEAMARLNDISSQVQDSNTSMHEASANNRKAIERVEHISKVTSQSVREIAEALEVLVAEMETVTSVTEKAGAVSETLENEVRMFKVQEEPSSDISRKNDSPGSLNESEKL